MQNPAQNGSSPTRSSYSAYFSIKDAANYLGVTVNVIYQLLKDDSGPPHLKIATNKKKRPIIRIPKKEFFAWAKQNER